MAEKRRLLLDPCHSKVLNITNLQIARTKLKLKLELRALRKIIDGALRNDENSIIILPENVYENPLETIPNQFHEGIDGHFGSATEDQLKAFFGDTSAKANASTHQENCTKVFVKSEPTSDPVKAFDYNSVSLAVEDMELERAISSICHESNNADSNMQVDKSAYLTENVNQDCVLFDLNKGMNVQGTRVKPDIIL